MRSFSLKIVTPDGLRYDGQAQELIVRTTSGDLGIAPLGMGEAMILVEDRKRYGACIGGMVSVLDGAVTLVPTTFEWAEDIDQRRASESRKRAEAILHDKNSSDTDLRLAEARLKRALIRTNVSQRKK